MRALLLMCKKFRGGNSSLLLIVPHEHQGSVLDWMNDHHLNFLPICWPCAWATDQMLDRILYCEYYKEKYVVAYDSLPHTLRIHLDFLWLLRGAIWGNRKKVSRELKVLCIRRYRVQEGIMSNPLAESSGCTPIGILLRSIGWKWI